MEPGALFQDRGDCGGTFCGLCPLREPGQMGRAGLLWVGERFYPTPRHFELEAEGMGISRRIARVPRGFVVGVTWVLLAHAKAVRVPRGEPDSSPWVPGVFRVFKPQRVEKILAQSAATPEVVEALREAGVTPVVVPDADQDHRGSVYDEEEAALPLQ